MEKIVIVIRGGCLASVFCDNPEAEVQLLDFDNAEEVDPKDKDRDEMTAPEIDREVEIAESTLAEVF
jgi:hypothetical protein